MNEESKPKSVHHIMYIVDKYKRITMPSLTTLPITKVKSEHDSKRTDMVKRNGTSN